MFRRILGFCVVGLLVVMVGCGSSRDKGEKKETDAAIERSKVDITKVKKETDAAIERSKVDITKVKKETDAAIREAQQIQAYAEIIKTKIGVDVSKTQVYTDREKSDILAEADKEQALILAASSIKPAKLQALIGAVRMRLEANSSSERIEAEKQVKIAEAAASTGIPKAEVSADGMVKIVSAMAQAETEQQLIRFAATVAAIRILRK